jgi:hypothetical protein
VSETEDVSAPSIVYQDNYLIEILKVKHEVWTQILPGRPGAAFRATRESCKGYGSLQGQAMQFGVISAPDLFWWDEESVG